MNNNFLSIQDQGYALLKSVFTQAECNNLKAMALKDISSGPTSFNAEGSNSILSNKSDEKILNNLHSKRIEYYDFITNQVILSAVKPLLQIGSYKQAESFCLLNSQIRALNPQAGAQQLHIDSNVPGNYPYPLVVIVIVMLDDFTESNGATRIVPHSHKKTTFPVDDIDYDDEILITGKAGDVIVINGALWHGSSVNKTNKERWSINIGYGRWFIKPSFDIPRSLPKDIYDQLDDFQRELLGLRSVPALNDSERISRRSIHDYRHWEMKY
jgi:ectoine hydroxylase-related dioxygenase (phytanoyl-CoA dioxygenase family)